jgi:hypothetical protein
MSLEVYNNFYFYKYNLYRGKFSIVIKIQHKEIIVILY